MKKVFTLKRFIHTPISHDKGSAVWELQDERGHVRKINAVTVIDTTGLIESAHPIYAREAPLVDQLLQLNEEDKFEIDFRSYNQRNQYVQRDRYQEPAAVDNWGISGNVGRVVVIIGLITALWMAWTLVDNMVEFAQQSPTHWPRK